MRSVITLLLAAFMAPSAPDHNATSDIDAGVLRASAFCADVHPFTAFTIADDEFADDEFADDRGCSESDGDEPLDVEAELDSV